MWAGADADFDRALSFTPGAFIWERDKAHLVELPALWVRVPTNKRDKDDLGAAVDEALAAEGCPAPHWLIAGDAHVFAVWAIEPLRRPAKGRPEEHHAAFRAVLEQWRRAAMKLSFALEPLGARPLDVALVDDLLLGYVPAPFAEDSPLHEALGLHDEAPLLLRGTSDPSPIRVADVSKPLRRFDNRLFGALGVPAPRRGRRSWLLTPTSQAALEPKAPGGRHPAAVDIVCAARWDGEDYDQILARLRAWAATCAQDGTFPARRGAGDELELLTAWSIRKLKPGGPDKPTAGAQPELRQTTSDAITVALIGFLRAQGGAWVGAKGALAQQVALWRVEAGQPGLCPLTTLKRVLRDLKATGQLIHEVDHDGQTWRSTWRLRGAGPSGPEGAPAPPRGQKEESTWAPALALSSSEGAAGERLLPAGGVWGGPEHSDTAPSEPPGEENHDEPQGPQPVSCLPELTDSLIDALADVAPELDRETRSALLADARSRLRPTTDVLGDFETALRKRATRIHARGPRQRRLSLVRLDAHGHPRGRRKGVAGTGLPELTDDIVDACADVAPSLDRAALRALLVDARSRMRPRPRVLEDFTGALRKRAARIHRRRLHAAMVPLDHRGERKLADRLESRTAAANAKPPLDTGVDIAALFAAARLPFDQRPVVDRAQRLHLEGLSVIPLHPGSKEPATTWTEWQARQMPLAELRRHLDALGSDAGLAVICGAVSGVVVADLDDESAVQWARQHLPPTPWMTRTSRGEHWYYRAPTEPLTAGVPPWVGQLQADGKYVVAPGSRHPDGGTYAAIGDWSRARSELPVFDPRWLVDVTALRAARLRIIKRQ